MAKAEKNTAVLVIGGGVAGIEASLLLANSGRKVYLVEKTSYIGGNVIKFEEVFPNMECATCMIAPKQQELLQNPNIELLRLSKVIAVTGEAGAFAVTVEQQASYINSDNCIGCNACFEPCPVEVGNEFEEGLSQRKAIYIPCAGALPNVPHIDTANCLRFTGQDCQACQEACLFEAIDYTQQDEVINIDVGNIIVTTGFESYDPSGLSHYGYRHFSNVYSAMEVERLLASNGPTQGEVLLKNGKPPKTIAIIHCVGRDKKGYCSSICCMASLKIAHFIKKKLPDTGIIQFYTDLCIPGKAYQKFYEDVKGNGVDFIRAEVAEIQKEGKWLTVNYITDHNRKDSLKVDMVVLNPALEPPQDSAELATILSLPQGQHGFFSEKTPDLSAINTEREGIFIAGCAQGPKDITDTVAEAEAAVGQLLSLSAKESK
jgi:heterodisulfide reductase subunit A